MLLKNIKLVKVANNSVFALANLYSSTRIKGIYDEYLVLDNNEHTYLLIPEERIFNGYPLNKNELLLKKPGLLRSFSKESPLEFGCSYADTSVRTLKSETDRFLLHFLVNSRRQSNMHIKTRKHSRKNSCLYNGFYVILINSDLRSSNDVKKTYQTLLPQFSLGLANSNKFVPDITKTVLFNLSENRTNLFSVQLQLNLMLCSTYRKLLVSKYLYIFICTNNSVLTIGNLRNKALINQIGNKLRLSTLRNPRKLKWGLNKNRVKNVTVTKKN